MEDFKYKSIKDYINKYPSLLNDYLNAFEDNSEKDFLELELNKMKDLHFSYKCIYSTGVPPFKPLDYIPTPEEKEKIQAGQNTTTSIKRIAEFLENKINNFNPASSKISESKNIKPNKSLIFDGKELNLLERYNIANKLLDIENKIRILKIADLDKYQLLAYILGCDKDNARNLMNGTYKSKDRDLKDYFNDLGLNK